MDPTKLRTSQRRNGPKSAALCSPGPDPDVASATDDTSSVRAHASVTSGITASEHAHDAGSPVTQQGPDQPWPSPGASADADTEAEVLTDPTTNELEGCCSRIFEVGFAALFGVVAGKHGCPLV